MPVCMCKAHIQHSVLQAATSSFVLKETDNLPFHRVTGFSSYISYISYWVAGVAGDVGVGSWMKLVDTRDTHVGRWSAQSARPIQAPGCPRAPGPRSGAVPLRVCDSFASLTAPSLMMCQQLQAWSGPRAFDEFRLFSTVHLSSFQPSEKHQVDSSLLFGYQYYSYYY